MIERGIIFSSHVGLLFSIIIVNFYFGTLNGLDAAVVITPSPYLDHPAGVEDGSQIMMSEDLCAAVRDITARTGLDGQCLILPQCQDVDEPEQVLTDLGERVPLLHYLDGVSIHLEAVQSFAGR